MAALSSTIETLRRKLVRSLAQRGPMSTLRRCITKPLQELVNIVRSTLPDQRQLRCEEQDFDRRHHVDTQADRDPGWAAAIASPNWMHGIGYAPVPFADLADVLNRLDLPWEAYTFVDLGAGKGRALFVAAEFPFKHVTGVEYSRRLATVLQSNIASYRNPRRRCWSMDGIFGDAAEYAFPSDPLVLFFHHPFETVVFRQVVKRLEASLEAHPRRIVAIYYDPKCEQVFAQSTSFQRILQGSAHPGSAHADWVVYEADPASGLAPASLSSDHLTGRPMEAKS